MSNITIEGLAFHLDATRRRNVQTINLLVRQYARVIVAALANADHRLPTCDTLVLLGSRGPYLSPRAKAVRLAAAVARLPTRYTEPLSRALPSPEHVRVFVSLLEGFCGVVFVEPEVLERGREEGEARRRAREGQLSSS